MENNRGGGGPEQFGRKPKMYFLLEQSRLCARTDKSGEQTAADNSPSETTHSLPPDTVLTKCHNDFSLSRTPGHDKERLKLNIIIRLG